MFKLNKIFYLVTVAALVLVSVTSAFAWSDIWNVTPTNDAIWPAGSTQDVTWSYINNNYLNNCNQTISLIPASVASSLPTYNGERISQANGLGSGRLVIPPDAIPGEYRVKVRCAVSEYTLSAGIVTLANPSFQPLAISLPVTPITYATGAYVPIVVNADNVLAVGTPVTVKLVKKSDQTPVWTPTGDAACILTTVGSPIPYCGTAIQTSESSQFAAGVYLLKAEVQFNNQTYVTSSGDITFTASTPPPPDSTTITNLQTDRASYAIGDTITITWNTNLTDKNDLTLKRYESDGTFIAQATPNNLLSHTVVVGGTFTVGQSYYYTLTGGSPAVTAQSGNFAVTAGDGEPPPPPPPPPHRSWAPPLYSPPDCDGDQGFDPGCFPPINVSVEPQIKSGLLTVGGLISTLGATIQGVFRLPSGWQSGFVLTATSDNKAEWRPGGTGPGGGVSKIIAGSNITISPTSGIGEVTINSTGGGGGPTDETVWQRRVSGNCAPGSAIRDINQDGTVACETNDLGTGAGGGDITGIITDNFSGLEGGVDSGSANLKLRSTCSENQILKYRKNIAGVSGWFCSNDDSGAGAGDNLGNHIATQPFTMRNNEITFGSNSTVYSSIKAGDSLQAFEPLTISSPKLRLATPLNGSSGQVLTANSQGYAEWRTLSPTEIVSSAFSIAEIYSSGDSTIKTIDSLLPSGKSAFFCSVIQAVGQCEISFTSFSSNPSTYTGTKTWKVRGGGSSCRVACLVI